MLKPSQKLPALTSVWIPDLMRLNDNVMPAGQNRRLPRQAVGARTLRRRPGAARLSDRRTGAERRPDRHPPRSSPRPGPSARSILSTRRAGAKRSKPGTGCRSRPLTWSPPARPVPPSTCARKPRRRAIATAATPGAVVPAGSAADRSRRAPRFTSTGRASPATRRWTTRCGTRTPRTPTACRMRSVRCSTSASTP